MDSQRIAYPLFPVDGQGELPTSPKQLEVVEISKDKFRYLNELWHSRLPFCNPIGGFCYGAEYKNIFYAVACFTSPIARAHINKNWLELRRYAISEDAPKYTATSVLSKMIKLIRRSHETIVKLISYQDTFVHDGTIYKAGNWKLACHVPGISWQGRKGRIDKTLDDSGKMSDKIRWEYDLR